MASADTTAQVDSFPSADEAALVALIPDADRDRCEPAGAGDSPELLDVVRAGVPPVTIVNRRSITMVAGIECALGGITAPDTVWYWQLREASEGTQWISEHAGAIDAPSGSCAAETPAVESWEFGDGGGQLLCFTTETGDAILVWNYGGSDLMGRAVRDDRDMAALLRWWSEEARFVSVGP